MDEEKLILEVQNHSILYDTSHPFFKDNTRKDRAWATISERLEVDVNLCKAKWRTLRDAFVRSKKKVSASGSAGGSQKEWKYKEIMSFLLPHVTARRSKSNLSNVMAEEERSSTPLSQCGSEEPATGSLSEEPPPDTPSPAIPDRPARSRSPRERAGRGLGDRSRRGRGYGDVEERLLSILEEPAPRPKTVEDECFHFALSLVPGLVSLGPDQRHRAKIEILNTLHRYKTGQLEQTAPPPATSTSARPPPQPGAFRPVHYTTGPFTRMLESVEDPQWEDTSNI